MIGKVRGEILEIIRHEWLYGREIVARSEAEKGSVRRGTVYVHLEALVDAGFAESRLGEVSHGTQMYQYRATSRGLREWGLTLATT
jgi:DNA-binding PadR family transcriptional regulator